MPEQQPQPQARRSAKPAVGMAALILLVGAPAAKMFLDRTPRYEGVVLVGYRDVTGTPTKCMGDTADVVVGKRYTLAECRDSMIRQIIAHAGPALRCAPAIKGHALVTWAAGDYAYNAGVGRFCRDVAPYFAHGNWRGGCFAMRVPTTSKGRVFPGLVNRRHDEVAACLEGLK
jgi:lysozyme